MELREETRKAYRRYMDAVREDMAVVEMTEEDANDTDRTKMEVGNPLWRPLTGEAERRSGIRAHVYVGTWVCGCVYTVCLCTCVHMTACVCACVGDVVRANVRVCVCMRARL